MEKSPSAPEKAMPAPPEPAPAPSVHHQRIANPLLTKAAPNDLYRRLLPAALFLLTFVTVMTMLLMYMDTTALRARQFRLNMTHDYDLGRIAQDDPSLVAYVRQLQLSVGARPRKEGGDEPEGRVREIVAATGDKYNGTFVEILVTGSRAPTTSWLEQARGWTGLAVRADPRDYFTLRSTAVRGTDSLHACLSPVSHPKEVTYYESAGTWRHDGVSVDALNSEGVGFSSRVLCFPLYTLLLVGHATTCDYLLLSSPGALRALHTLPFHKVQIQMIEVHVAKDAMRNSTTEFLNQKGYQVRAAYHDAVLYEKTTKA